jgi:hypothetical protein
MSSELAGGHGKANIRPENASLGSSLGQPRMG